MKLPAISTLLLAHGLAVMLLAAGCDEDCAPGAKSIAGQCRGLRDGPGSTPVTCGNGELDADEACDDGNDAVADGCEPTCRLTPGWSCEGTTCKLVPTGKPILQGVPSSDPDYLTWAWQAPVDAAEVQVSIDGGQFPFTWVDDHTVAAPGLPPGSHTIAVAACNSIGGCGAAVEHTTRVERFGPQSRPWFRGVKRALARPVIGGADMMTAVACDDCFEGADGEVVAAEVALPSLATALSRGADVIDLDVVLIAGELYVARLDDVRAGDRPALTAFLADSTLRTSDAPLQLEVQETEGSSEEFADALFTALEDHPEYIRNGRPLFIRVPLERTHFLSGVRAAASLHPFLEPYVRYWVTIPSAADWEMAVDGTADSGYHGVTFDFREPELLRRVGLAHARGLGVWIDNVPGPGHGEVVFAGLRQSVDGFTTSYRIDQARAIVAAEDVQALFDAAPLTSPEEPLLVHYLQADGTPAAWQRMLAVPTGEELGTPELAWWSDNGPFSGGALDFGSGDRAMRLTDPPVGALGGVLVSVSATLGDVAAIAPGEYANILSSATSMAASEHQGGVALRLARAAQGGVLGLQFAVHAGDRYWVHDYPFAGGSTGACSSPNGTFTEPLEEGRAYWLLGVYDGGGPVQLFIDGKCAGAAVPEATGSVTGSLFAPLVGAQPETALPGGSGFFRGVVQSAQLLSWPSHDADGTN